MVISLKPLTETKSLARITSFRHQPSLKRKLLILWENGFCNFLFSKGGECLQLTLCLDLAWSSLGAPQPPVIPAGRRRSLRLKEVVHTNCHLSLHCCVSLRASLEHPSPCSLHTALVIFPFPVNLTVF